MKTKKVNLILLITCMILLVTATPLFSHHFKGLPHFSYFKNYPQIPQEEFMGQKGTYEFSLVIYDFQGLDIKELSAPDVVRLYLVIFNLQENKTYNGPLILSILNNGEPILTKAFDKGGEESVYSLHEKLPLDGKYSLKIDIYKGTRLEAEIPFILSSQKINWGKWVLASLVFLVIVLIIGSRKARIMIDRKENYKKNFKKNEESKSNILEKY